VEFHHTSFPDIPSSSYPIYPSPNIATLKATLITCI
jgi:hypothetical protein